MKKIVQLTEEELIKTIKKVISEQHNYLEGITIDDLNSLKKVYDKIPKELVANWFYDNSDYLSDKGVVYYGNTDLELYIIYIENNLK